MSLLREGCGWSGMIPVRFRPAGRLACVKAFAIIVVQLMDMLHSPDNIPRWEVGARALLELGYFDVSEMSSDRTVAIGM